MWQIIIPPTLDSSRMRRQLSSHFCPGKVPLCTYCSVHVISFLPRHPAGTYPLECLFHRYVGARDWEQVKHDQHGSALYTYGVALITELDVEHWRGSELPCWK